MKLKSRYGSWRALGIVGHLQVGEVAVGGEVVADRPRAARAVFGAPGNARGDGTLLLAREEERGAVEEDADPASGAEKLESPEDLQAIDPPLAPEPRQRRLEADAHRVSGRAAEVLEHEEEQSALELDVEHDIGFPVLRGGGGHVLSLRRKPPLRKAKVSVGHSWRNLNCVSRDGRRHHE